MKEKADCSIRGGVHHNQSILDAAFHKLQIFFSNNRLLCKHEQSSAGHKYLFFFVFPAMQCNAILERESTSGEKWKMESQLKST